MNLLIAINDNYFEPAFVTMKTFVKYNQGKHRLFILHKELSDSYIQELRQFLQKCDGSELIDIRVDDEIYKSAPLYSFFTIEIYFRILSHLYLPEELDRILYLDVDMVVMKSLSDFYKQDFSGKCIVAAADLGGEEEAARLGISKTHTYFNSGVILMNLPLIRQYVDEALVKKYLTEYKDRLRLPDQDLLNLMYAERTKTADWQIYNHQIRGSKAVSKAEQQKIREESAILHYIDKQKPWQLRYENNQDVHFLKVYAERKPAYGFSLYIIHRVHRVLALIGRSCVNLLKKNSLTKSIGSKIKHFFVKF